MAKAKLDYFSADEYAGGYDEISLALPRGVEQVVITLYYQGTSRDYVEFLRDEIKGTRPIPWATPNAYIIQTDPFFTGLRAWGDAMWDLWWHNHGLDGSGVALAGIVPFRNDLSVDQYGLRDVAGRLQSRRHS